MSEAEKQLHRHIKPLVIGSNPICRTHATVAQQVEQEKTLFRYSRTFLFLSTFPMMRILCLPLIFPAIYGSYFLKYVQRKHLRIEVFLNYTIYAYEFINLRRP